MVTQHPGLNLHHFFERPDSLFGFYFLDKANNGIENDHRQDNGHVNIFMQKKGNNSSREKHIDQRALKLVQQDGKYPDLFLSCQNVGPDLRETLLSLFTAESGFRGFKQEETFLDI